MFSGSDKGLSCLHFDEAWCKLKRVNSCHLRDCMAVMLVVPDIGRYINCHFTVWIDYCIKSTPWWQYIFLYFKWGICLHEIIADVRFDDDSCLKRTSKKLLAQVIFYWFILCIIVGRCRFIVLQWSRKWCKINFGISSDVRPCMDWRCFKCRDSLILL